MFNTTQLSEEEKKIFDFDQNIINQFIIKLDKGWFYLGGQLKMKHNDIINLDFIQKVREIDRERFEKYGGPYNSLEAASICQHNKDIEFIENMIKKYDFIISLREVN
jgi:hypothetical protein